MAMKKFLISLAGGAVISLIAYLIFALPQYLYWRAHQPHWIVVNDAWNLNFALPASQGSHLETTDPNATSFPPSAAFVLMLPVGAFTLIAATFVLWVMSYLWSQRKVPFQKPNAACRNVDRH